MSRVGKKPVPIPEGVQVQVRNGSVTVRGPRGTLEFAAPPGIRVEVDDQARLVRVNRASDEKQHKAFHGLTRALIANMVHGVVHGYSRELHIYGTGYNCKLQGRQLHLNVGFMGQGHNRPAQFMIDIPDGIEVEVLVPAARGESEPARLVVRGIDKQKVGQFAAQIRKIRPPEPYQGKGIRYSDEIVRRKQGKAAV